MQIQHIQTTSPDAGIACARNLSDDALLASIRTLLGRERRITAELIAHLAEIEARGLHQREGYSSLFGYCRDALGLSEHEAYGRIEAARAARKFPLVLELLRGGSITITTVSLLARHLTPENQRAILESACGKKKAEVEEIVASLWPSADAPATLRKLPATPPAAGRSAWAPTPSLSVGPPAAAALSRPVVPQTSGATPSPAPIRHPVPVAPAPAPLSPDRYRYQLTIDGETRDLLALAKDMLRHADPCGDDAALLKRALELLVFDLARKRFGAAGGRRTARPTASGSRHVSANVKRVVFVRDRGRCAFVGRQGHRCNERGFLEFHHVRPYAAGGDATAENIELRCRSHNQHEARLYFERRDEGPLPTRAGSQGAGRTDAFQSR